MVFDSVAALLNMEGHGLYVWSVYGIGVVCLVGLVYQNHRLAKRVRTLLRREVNRRKETHEA